MVSLTCEKLIHIEQVFADHIKQIDHKLVLLTLNLYPDPCIYICLQRNKHPDVCQAIGNTTRYLLTFLLNINHSGINIEVLTII